jgi:hypothetical protein
VTCLYDSQASRKEERRIDHERTPRERRDDLIRSLVPDWRPTATQILWAIRIAIVLGILVLVGYSYGITLWDWAQLLIVPAVIAAGGIWFNQQQREREQFTEEQRAQDDALQAYLDYVSKLMVDHLDVSSAERTPTKEQPGEASTVSPTIASKEDITELTPDNPLVLINLRARTLAVLERLDPHRKVNVLGFLYELGAIYKYSKAESAAVSLYGADLSGVDMSGSNWSYIDLSGSYFNEAILINADLTDADLTDADLTDVNLFDAIVTQEQLAKCSSLVGATMPDGSKQD